MSVKSLRGSVVSASAVPLLNQVTVRGKNTYTLGTNMLSWDEVNVYTLTQVSHDFGQAVATGGPDQLRFKCGNSDIGAFDFGLLFSCFIGISTAYAESNITLATSNDDTSTPGISVVWFGNYGIVYSRQHNLIIPMRSYDIQSACKFERVILQSFTDVRTFQLKKEGMSLLLVTEKNEQLCVVRIPASLQRAYPTLFADKGVTPVTVDNPDTPWDERSQLGSLIAGSISTTDAESMVAQYKARASVDSTSGRNDLICMPEKRYSYLQEIIGSIAYTDKHTIALAVNFRNNLFVYQPWFTGNTGSKHLESDATPKLSEFYDVTEECKQIAVYAATVSVLPLTVAQFDVAVFDDVREAFYAMKLPRVSLGHAFGRIVIPEPVLLHSLSAQSAESIYCFVPVGVIGANLICKDADGQLRTIEMRETSTGAWEPCGLDTAFYDITGVVS